MIKFFAKDSGVNILLGMESESKEEIESWHYSLYNLEATDNPYGLVWTSETPLFAYCNVLKSNFYKWVVKSISRQIYNNENSLFKSIKAAKSEIRRRVQLFHESIVHGNFLGKQKSCLTIHQVSPIFDGEREIGDLAVKSIDTVRFFDGSESLWARPIADRYW